MDICEKWEWRLKKKFKISKYMNVYINFIEYYILMESG